MTAEDRIAQAIHLIRVMQGNGVIDLPKLVQTLQEKL